jgi:hypothetical protein
MSGMSSPITVLTAPYNTINNPNVISLNTRFTPKALKEINQTPNYDVVSNPIKPKECIECFDSNNTSKDKIPIEDEYKSNLVGDNLVDTAIYDYLASKDDYYDNKNQMVDNTIPYDPLKSLVKDYLKDNISMYDNRGKYFDQYLFNKKFDEYIDQKNKERLLKEKVRLYDLNKVENIKINPYDLPLNKLLINTKNTWFNMYDDLSNGKDPTKNLDFTSLFYIGITLIVVVILYVLLSFIFS